jgi:hypothetical protein
MSKTSDELVQTLKSSSPKNYTKPVIITPEMVKAQLSKRGVNYLKHEESLDSNSDDESTIRKIIEQRKALSPITYQEIPSPQIQKLTERKSFNTSTTALTSSEDNNLDRVLHCLEELFLPGEKNLQTLKTLESLMQKCTEPSFGLALNDEQRLKGIYYLEAATGYFHRIVADDDLPIVLPPRRIKEFLVLDPSEKRLSRSTILRFEAFVYI